MVAKIDHPRIASRTMISPMLKSMAANTPKSPCVIMTVIPTSPSRIPTPCATLIFSRVSSHAGNTVNIGWAALINAALIAVVKLSENRNNAELPTCKKPNSKISLKCALIMLNFKKSSRHTNGRKISVARTQRQNDKPKAGISS